MKTGYLIDMDGVIYRENHLIPGAAEFVDGLVSTGTPFLFLTNNSAPTPEDLAVRMKHLGIQGLTARSGTPSRACRRESSASAGRRAEVSAVP